MSLPDRVWGGAARVARALAPVAAALRPALSRPVAERRAAAAELEAWGAREVSGSAGSAEDPLLWLHGASAGELLGAAPAVERARRERPFRLLVTHTSPSGAPAAAALGPGWRGYPPFDAPADCRRAVRGAAPEAIVFAKGDVWPGLTRAAADAGIPLGLVNGTVRPGSSRLRAPARWLLRPAHRRLDRVGAVSEADADRLTRLGARPGAIRLTGDAAFDRALARADRALAALGAAPGAVRRDAGTDVPILVAGSTWPADEEALLRAAARLASRGRPLRLALVPHEPTEAAVRALTDRCARTLGRAPLRWSEGGHGGAGADDGTAGRDAAEGAAAEAAAAPAVRLRALLRRAAAEGRPVVVDALGVLADLYAAADVAYVGGGFGRAGLHSVIEPAAAGVPVLFGPRHERREAAELLERGGARAADAAGLADALEGWLAEPEARRAAGARGRAYVEAEAGAAGATAALILELLEAGRGAPLPGPVSGRARTR